MSFGAALCALLLALVATPARAQDDPGRLHFQAGASDYESGDYRHALGEFQRAYELSQRPQLFYNISLCYQQLGDRAQAVEFLGRYLNEVEEIPNRAALERRLANFQERLEAERAAATTTAGDTTASDTTASDTTATDTTASDATASDTTASDTTASVEPAPHESGANVPAIMSFIGGGVGLAMAVSFGVMALSEDSSVSSQPCAATRTCTNTDKMDTFALLSDVGTGLAVVGLGLGLVFLLTADDDEADPTRARLRLAPFAGPNAAGLTAQGSF